MHPGDLYMKKTKEILLTLLAIAFVLVFPHTGLIPLPFAYIIPVLLVIWIFLKLHKENFTDINFTVKEINTKALFTGTITAILLFAFLNFAFFPLLNKLVKLPPVDLGDIAAIKGNTGFYIFLLAMGWIVGGLYEEIVFHGFIFTRLEKLIPGKHVLLIAFFLCNILFAMYHIQLGLEGVINAFVAGCVYHALMLRYKRNMWYAIFCHAVFDTIALSVIYAGY